MGVSTHMEEGMSQPERFETLVLGSGQGGKLLAWHMARSGRRTAVVERKWIGGSCPNINCLPSKNEIWSAKVADLVHHAAKFGMVTGSTAIGECAGSPQFTHVSFDDVHIIRDNLAGGKRSTRDRLVPYCLFTDPPLARVGMSEVEARRQGTTPRVARLPMSAVLRTQTIDERQGFMKALVSESDDRILGFIMIGAEAGEVLAAVQTAMIADLPYS